MISNKIHTHYSLLLITCTHYSLLLITCLLLVGCSDAIKIDEYVDAPVDIYPDYAGVTVPQNIAPLNFNILTDGVCGAVISYKDKSLSVRAKDGCIDIPVKWWREAMEALPGDSLKFTACQRIDGKWVAYRPFYVHVSADSIDRTLVYRLIPPLYGTWREIGIYQRDLETYDESPIYENIAYHGNCVNCHSFCNRDADRMLFHLRGPGGGTYLKADDVKLRLDTKTDSTISNFTYPYWHPSGRYVAFSVNDIFQVFHNSDPNRTEVIDDASDVVVYDIKENRVLSSPLLKSPTALETFPSFSADGNTLYYCSAVKPDTLPELYKDVHYSLCALAFDPVSGRFGASVDTIFDAGVDRSVSFPRPSPDGKRLVATVGSYGNFSIWHKDADLWMYDINSRQWRPLTAANSDDVESYHSWSGNSRWLVFSSRRDDGYYTRPYFVHIADDGAVSKPFMLPQRNPKKYYTDQENSFNIPELVSGPVDLTTRQVVDWISCPAVKVR